MARAMMVVDVSARGEALRAAALDLWRDWTPWLGGASADLVARDVVHAVGMGVELRRALEDGLEAHRARARRWDLSDDEVDALERAARRVLSTHSVIGGARVAA